MPNEKLGRKILKGILWSGLFVVACGSSNFIPKVLPQIGRLISYNIKKSKSRKDKEKNIYNAFNYLRKKGLLRTVRKNKQIYIFLTAKGKSLAGRYQIDDLEIKRPKKWDRLWRILIFDVKENQRIKRDALRGKIKQLGLYQLQKSVWVHPYSFHREMGLLREFFGLDENELTTITAYEIENDRAVRDFFKLR